MAVGRLGELRVLMAKHLLDGDERHSGAEEQRGGAVPEVVEPNRPHGSSFRAFLVRHGSIRSHAATCPRRAKLEDEDFVTFEFSADHGRRWRGHEGSPESFCGAPESEPCAVEDRLVPANAAPLSAFKALIVNGSRLEVPPQSFSCFRRWSTTLRLTGLA